MSLAVIDVGSNSVRLLLNGEKTVVNTRLAEKAGVGSYLLPDAMQRTAEAIVKLRDTAVAAGATVAVFATEAVRSAANKEEFLNLLAEYGLAVDVLTPEIEAKLGFDGAYCGDGELQAVLDVGGASAELAVGNKDGIIYSHSLPLGSVRLRDYSDDPDIRKKYARARVTEYGAVPKFERLITIGGTSSSIVAVRDAVAPYSPEKIHMQTLTLDEVEAVVNRIDDTPMAARLTIVGLHPQKIDVVPAGGTLIAEIMRYLNVTECTVSERDNLEGYQTLMKNEE